MARQILGLSDIAFGAAVFIIVITDCLEFGDGQFGNDGYFANKVNSAERFKYGKVNHDYNQGEYTIASVKDSDECHKIFPLAFYKRKTAERINATEKGNRCQLIQGSWWHA